MFLDDANDIEESHLLIKNEPPENSFGGLAVFQSLRSRLEDP